MGKEHVARAQRLGRPAAKTGGRVLLALAAPAHALGLLAGREALKRRRPAGPATSATATSVSATAPAPTAPDPTRQQLTLLEEGAAALARAQADSPDHPDLLDFAHQLHEKADAFLTAQGGTASPNGHQRDPVLQRAQRVLDSAELVRHRGRVQQARTKGLDQLQDEMLERRKSPLGLANPHLHGVSVAIAGSTTAPATPDTSHLDAAVLRAGLGDTYEGAVRRWSGPDSDQPGAREALLTLEGMSGTEFPALIALQSFESAQRYGLHPSEEGALRSYTSSGYQAMNAAASGDAGYVAATAANAQPALHGDSLKTDEDRVKQAAAVKHLAPVPVRGARPRRASKGKQPEGATRDAARSIDGATSMNGATSMSGTASRAAAAEPTVKELTELERLDLARARHRTLVSRDGSALTAAALSGLLKMPARAGTVWRMEHLTHEQFDKAFTVEYTDGEPVISPRTKATTSTYLLSSSKDKEVAKGWTIVGAKDHMLLYEIAALDGRDLTAISISAAEMEVLLLPGTRLEIDRIVVTGKSTRGALKEVEDLRPTYDLTIHARQVSAPRLAPAPGKGPRVPSAGSAP